MPPKPYASAPQEELAGPLNVDCTAERWWGNTCCLQPQSNPGIPQGHPISDACISTIDSFCLDVRAGVTAPGGEHNRSPISFAASSSHRCPLCFSGGR